MIKSSYFTNYLWVLFTVAVLCAVLLAHTCIVWLALAGGFVISLLACRLLLNKWWKCEPGTEMPAWKKWILAAISAALGSQIGWVALLI